MSFDIHVKRIIGERVIDFTLQSASGVIALHGPSGVGKTSILNMVAGLLKPDAGRIAIGGHILFDNEQGVDVPPSQRDCGYVFQDFRLFPHMSVAANLRYGATRKTARSATDGPDPEAMIDTLGIAPLLTRRPTSLSGGEAQRVAIGRALLSRPRYLLMDEPLSSIDKARRQDILSTIGDWHVRTRIPIIYVSHDVRELELFDGGRIEMVSVSNDVRA